MGVVGVMGVGEFTATGCALCGRLGTVVECFGGYIEASRPADGVEGYKGLAKEVFVLKWLKNAFLKVGPGIEKPRFAGVEFDFEHKAVKGTNGDGCGP